MSKQLPDDWISGKKRTLNVVTDLGFRNVPAGNLTISKYPPSKNSELLFCRWLPLEDEDTRPYKGRTNEGTGKRKYLEGTTGHSDPYLAGKSAVEWCKKERKKLQQLVPKNTKHTLDRYWSKYWAELEKEVGIKQRKLRDTFNRWNGKEWGVGQQEFASKSVEEIDALDIEAYFKLLDARGTGKKGSMAKQKEAVKSLINKLFAIARYDLPLLQNPIYPVIHKDDVEVEGFTQQEWDKIVTKVIELSGGKAREEITYQEYQDIEWNRRGKLEQQRNWIDFYDCLMLQWFFYLRALDMPRLQSDWLKDMGDDTVVLYIYEPKQDRAKYETHHYRPDAYKFWRRMSKRRPKGYLAFPMYSRRVGDENASNVKETLNDLLRYVAEQCGITKRNTVHWTMIRHTAFRLTLQEMPELGTEPYINTFAANGHTSAEMLRKRYLKTIDRQNVADKARAKLKPSDWSLIKRVGKGQ